MHLSTVIQNKYIPQDRTENHTLTLMENGCKRFYRNKNITKDIVSSYRIYPKSNFLCDVSMDDMQLGGHEAPGSKPFHNCTSSVTEFWYDVNITLD